MAHKYIGLQQLISLLGGEKKRGSKGEHICLCPAHDDKDPSLSVREGDKGIVMTCVSRGCTTEAICERLGIKMSELFFDPLPSTGSRRASSKPKSAKAAADDKDVKTYGSYGEAYGWAKKLVCTYKYCDSKGALQFEVARLIQKNGEKTFRQHRPVKPDGTDRCAFPIRLDVPAEMRESLIYRQQETEAAVAAGETVYIVEGEKDADTLWRLGLPASTNAGGGTKDKWKDGHTAHFKGAAEVVILPDNDATGEGHGEEVFRAVSKVADAAYIVNLRDGYPDLPPKGDFTDLVEAVGEQEALSVLETLLAEARESLWQKAQRAYADIPGYVLDHRRTCQTTETGPKMLCNFVALPVEIVETDDGLTVEKSMRIVGWNFYGRQLKPVQVPMAKFKTMDWVLENWDVEANIMPGNTVKDKLRWIITEAAFKVAKRKTVYSHCGWRRIDGRWAYLHQGGCIGAEGINVDMGNDLGDYTLAGHPDGMSVQDAAITSYSLTLNIPAYISVPLLGVTYLAPLCEFLDQVLCPPSFVTALIGAHGTHKTSIASLFLNHFGRFGIRGMPTNFTSTLNAVRRSAFAAKDALLLVDDYFPATSIQERRKMENIMQVISRTFGDKANRNRLNADLSMQKAMPARCIAMMTGEMMPDVGASGQARMYVIELDKQSYTYSADMDKLRQDAEDGALRLAMTSYLEWLLPQADALPNQLRDMFREYRKKAHDLIAGAATNDRADDAAAHIMIGLTMMTRWLESVGLMDPDGAAAQLAEWWNIVVSNTKAQGSEGKDDSPTSMFVMAAREMLLSGAVGVVDITPGEKSSTPRDMVGYCDAHNYYFLGKTLYKYVSKFYNDQNRIFPLGENALNKALREEGIVEQWDTAQGKTGKLKTIGGKPIRLIWIPRWKIDNTTKPAPSGTQTAMNLDEFTEVHDDELPWQE